MRSTIPHNTQSWYLEIYKDILENAEILQDKTWWYK